MGGFLCLLGLVFVFPFCQTTVVSRIQCANGLHCLADRPSAEWHLYHKRSVRLAKLLEFIEDEGNFTVGTSSSLYRDLTTERDFLCKDFSFTGFLLPEDALNWPQRCIWNGADRNGFCSPVDPSMVDIGKDFAFITPGNWSKKIREYRMAIGCSEEEIRNTQDIGEQYVCKENCMQAGIPYWASIILMVTFCVAWSLNCH